MEHGNFVRRQTFFGRQVISASPRMSNRIRIHSTLRHPAVRSLMEPKLHASQLVMPVFVSGHRKEDRVIGGFQQDNGGLKQFGYDGNYGSLVEE